MKWLGIGPGRCGTKFLAQWATDNGCPTSHESVRLAYEGPEVLAKIRNRMGMDPAEVSFMWTAHWKRAREADQDLPIICINRDKFDCVASHIRVCQGQDRLVVGRLDGKLSEPYPKLEDQRSSWLAWGHWYDLCNKWMAEVPQPVWHMWMEDLNCEEELAELRHWLLRMGRW